VRDDDPEQQQPHRAVAQDRHAAVHHVAGEADGMDRRGDGLDQRDRLVSELVATACSRRASMVKWSASPPWS
jgi:thymidylate synthase